MARKHSVRTVSELKTSKGTRFLPEQLTLREKIGEGSFGEVFQVCAGRHTNCVFVAYTAI